ncbi:MAG TPA: SusC/RagA family TonB-linked outer membrane protein [Longimicrobiales bacterium]|nr:SusC/RagA family TonB-linked outer membrane protein [Longimicrobiales bacterium]
MSKHSIAIAALCLLSLPGATWAQQRQLSGRVVSATGGPVAGAAVSVVGTAIIGATDASGNFRLDVPARAVTLVVRSIGYRTRELPVPADRGTVEVSLDVDVLNLDQVVVTGRATGVARRNLANSVATVQAAELSQAPPAETIERMLQGRVAGASIEQNSGAPGGGVQVRLRGIATINASSEPLYVVDGVIVSNVGIPSNQNEITKAAQGSNASLMQDAVVNRIVDINPEEIERIEVLEGPAAAAIYGSKAPAGVVIITTKRGQPGRPRVSFSQKLGTFADSKKLGSRTFETLEEAQAVWGPDAAKYYQPGQTFDQEKLLAGERPLSNETSASISGGDENTRYYASGLVKHDGGIIQNTRFDKQSVRVNLGQQVGSRLTVDASTNLLHTLASRGLTNNDNNTVSFYMTLPFTPNFVDLRQRADGSYPANPFALPGLANPLQTAALMKNNEDVWRFLGSSTITYDAFRSGSHSLRILGVGGLDYFSQVNDLFFPPELVFEPRDDGLPGTKLLSNSSNRNLNLGGNLIYTYESPAWRATTSAGAQYDNSRLEIDRTISRNLNGGLDKTDVGTVRDIREQFQLVKDFGMYLQEELLGVNERLLLTAGIRAERSSTFGDVAKWFYFPKAAASYRFPNLGPALNEVKLRLAWGQSGNHPLFGQKFTPLNATQNIGGIPGLTVLGNAGDPNIEPERTAEIEGGLDATLFGERATLEVTAYQKNITNLLLQRTTAPSTGFTAQFLNGGELRVRGITVGLAGTPLQRGNLTWVMRGTFSSDRGKVIDLPVPSFQTGGFGTSLGAFQIEEGKSPTQLVTNLGYTLENGEKVVKIGSVGDANPTFRVGFSNDLTWNRFGLVFLWDWAQGAKIVNLTRFLYDLAGNTVDYDKGPSVTEFDAFGDTISGTVGERRFLRWATLKDSRPYMEDGSYIKLREVTLSYRLPQNAVPRLFGGGAPNVRLSVSGRNLLVFTKYSGLDPEVSNFGNQAVARNIDVAPFPPSRSFWFSVDVGW